MTSDIDSYQIILTYSIDFDIDNITDINDIMWHVVKITEYLTATFIDNERN